MILKEKTTIEKISESLYTEGKIKLTPKEEELRQRYIAGYSLWIEHPEKMDRDVAKFLEKQFNVKRSQAYVDVAAIKSLLGNIRNATKEWHRYAVVEMLKKAYQKAEKEGDYFAMVAAADKIGRYTRLDQEDKAQIPYDQIVPPSWEPSDDITVLDERLHKPFNRERIERLRRQYDPDYAVDTPFEET